MGITGLLLLAFFLIALAASVLHSRLQVAVCVAASGQQILCPTELRHIRNNAAGVHCNRFTTVDLACMASCVPNCVQRFCGIEPAIQTALRLVSFEDTKLITIR